MTKLFEYVGVYRPTDKERKDGQKDKIIVPLTQILAADQNSAMILAGRAIPEEYIDRLSQIEVAVRPF
jgi:hypothetical protein